MDENIWIDPFEEDWKEFVKGIREENRKSNYRLLKVIKRVKGDAYLNSLKHVLKSAGTFHLIKFSKEKRGLIFKRPEWSGIGNVSIDQRSHAQGGMKQDIYIPLKPGKYLHIQNYIE